MARLLIATTNPAKLAEYRLLLRGLKLEPISLAEAGIRETPPETGASFAENAMIKARFYFKCSGLPTLADDGGLEIDALGGEPGIRSHRWVGNGREENEDRALIDEVIRRMENVPDGRRTARLKCALALVYRANSEVRERHVEAALEGVIARRAFPGFRPGFPYRAVLFIPSLNRFLAELGEEEEAELSQRRAAVERARPYLDEIAAGG